MLHILLQCVVNRTSRVTSLARYALSPTYNVRISEIILLSAKYIRKTFEV